MSLRILVVTTSYPRWPGDPSDTVIGGLVAHLTARPGVEVTVLAPGHPRAPALERADRLEVRRLTYFWPRSLQALAYEAGIPWNLRRSKIAWLNLPALMAAYAWAIVRHGRRADLIHAHWGVTGALAVLTRPLHRRPVVVTVHGSDWRTSLLPVRWMTHLAVARADAVTTPSDEFVEELQPLRGRPGPCIWLPNGAEFPAVQEIERLRALAAGKGAGCRLLSVGRLIPERRHDLLVMALARLRPRFPSATLTLIGDGPCAGDLLRLVADLGIADAVRLTGALPPAQVLERLYAADLYVSATTVESFGMAVLEAAAHGLPIVTTRVGYAARLVLEGETGYTVPVGDEEALVEAIAQMLGDPDRLHQAGALQRRRAEDLDLTWTAVAERLVTLYATLLEASGAGRRR